MNRIKAWFSDSIDKLLGEPNSSKYSRPVVMVSVHNARVPMSSAGKKEALALIRKHRARLAEGDR